MALEYPHYRVRWNGTWHGMTLSHGMINRGDMSLFGISVGDIEPPRGYALNWTTEKEPIFSRMAPLFKVLGGILEALEGATKEDNADWISAHSLRANDLVSLHLPSGAGFDGGSHIDFAKCKRNRLVFWTEFHHMVDGFYDGWTVHEIIVTPSLAFDFDLRVTGRDRAGIKDYIADTFGEALQEIVNPWPDCNEVPADCK